MAASSSAAFLAASSSAAFLAASSSAVFLAASSSAAFLAASSSAAFLAASSSAVFLAASSSAAFFAASSSAAFLASASAVSCSGVLPSQHLSRSASSAEHTGQSLLKSSWVHLARSLHRHFSSPAFTEITGVSPVPSWGTAPSANTPKGTADKSITSINIHARPLRTDVFFIAFSSLSVRHFIPPQHPPAHAPLLVFHLNLTIPSPRFQ